MFSLFARRLPRTTLSAIHLCARGVASDTHAVFVRLDQKIDDKISHQALKEGLAANFGPVERLWLAMPTGKTCVVTFQEHADAQRLMDKGTLEIPPAILSAQDFARPLKSTPRMQKYSRALDNTQRCQQLLVHNVPSEDGITAADVAKVFGQFGKVNVRQPTYRGYPRPFAFLYFETQEAADKALETIRSEEGIILEGARLHATYSIQEERPGGQYPVITADS
ncbi:hypothetical protein BDZ89DRAFT_1066264 [Hymenopellis radicata]|nr:hypothetical protein BDZ89DRAFT_1066264 [Hymenopellis radicata]